MLRTYKVTWIDTAGEMRSRTFAAQESVEETERLCELGRSMAENSRFGLSSLVWVYRCDTDGRLLCL